MAILIPFFQQLTGINIIIFYAPVLFKTIGLGNNDSLDCVVLISYFVAIPISFLSFDWYPTQLLCLLSGAIMLMGQVGLAVMLGQNGVATMSSSDVNKLKILIIYYLCGFRWSWGPLGWPMPIEMFPLEIRPAGQSIIVSVNMLFTFLVAQSFPSMLCHMKFGLFYFFTFGLVCMITFSLLLFLAGEDQWGRSLEKALVLE